ncbi:SDR family oxidoreductase [uncultured Tateyamaria sp.]|uniref:SDR family NAD(P)-dependent oxidoreductase n=1 Tax=uncultured Tateyamaria sp. TaxID=455651 RepID=UPI00262692F3|nr:SDR family oxidoreductase [uncultured Tateyamaria sp.]
MHEHISYILGGSSGMGFATAKQLVEDGHTVVLFSQGADRLNEAVAELNAIRAGSAESIQVNLRDADSVKDVIGKIDAESRHINHLVNAAGVFAPKPFIDTDAEDYDKYMELNRSTYFFTQAVVRNMMKNEGGSIVNIGSMWAHQAVKATPSAAYSMAKAGIHSLTQHLAMELGEHNIRVNAIAPAVVITPIYGAFIEPDKIKETLTDGFGAFHPIGRVGHVEDVANHAVFLLSDKSSWTTGAVHNVDGGVMAGRN